jgi:serine/threonine protein kinase
MIVGLILGMEYIHSQKVIHRDLKPGNLLLDERGRLYIGDFGTARVIGNHCGSSTGGTGTWGYMSPEVAGGESQTDKVDVFSFGCLLYEILFGRKWYTATATEGIFRQAREDVRPEIPDDSVHSVVKEVIQRCWASNPELRPSFSEIFAMLKGAKFPLFPEVDVDAVEAFIREVHEQASNPVGLPSRKP